MYLFYRTRHLTSWLPALLLGGAILFSSQQASLSVTPRYDDTTMELALVEEPPAPEPVAQPQPEPEVEPPPPEPEPEPEPQPEPAPVVPAPEPVIAAPPKPQPKPKPKPEVKATPKAQEKPRPAAAPTRSAATTTKPPVASAPARPAAPQVNVQALENGYLVALRRELDSLKRYPTGRQASLERPQGGVEVWLEVDRSGRVLNSGIASKHRSMLLNRAASSSLQNLRQVKPFPEQAFAGQSTKRFTATFNYQAP